MSKQDRQGVRTPADIERKYNIGKNFAAAQSSIQKNREFSDDVYQAVLALDQALDQEEIFDRLTNGGKAAAIYTDEAGNLYINASYIKKGTLLASLLTGTIKSADEAKIVIDLDSGTATLTGTLSGSVSGTVTTKAEASGEYTLQASLKSSGVTITSKKDGTRTLSLRILGDRAYLSGLTAPVSSTDAANKAYVDALESQVLYSSMMAGTLLAGRLTKAKIQSYYTKQLWTAANVNEAATKGIITADEAAAIIGTGGTTA